MVHTREPVRMIRADATSNLLYKLDHDIFHGTL
jgi:hypothetical protein